MVELSDLICYLNDLRDRDYPVDKMCVYADYVTLNSYVVFIAKVASNGFHRYAFVE